MARSTQEAVAQGAAAADLATQAPSDPDFQFTTLAETPEAAPGPDIAPSEDPPGLRTSVNTAPRASAEMAGSLTEQSSAEGRGSAALMALVACVGLAGLAAVLAYLRHDAIAAAAPQLAEPLASYVGFIDSLRARFGG
jgi:hypothetical protein